MKRLLSEVHRFRELAGIKSEMELGLKPDQLEEMHVDSYGELIDDQEYFNRIFNHYKGRLRKALNARHIKPDYKMAYDFTKKWLETIAEELGLDSSIPFMEDEMFSGKYPAEDAVAYAREMFISRLEDEGRLQEDDYDMGTPSGDTGAMNIAEDDFSGTMRAVEDDPVV